MKTKIIYISGDEVFDMADIRAAFEEVRSALNLGTDTVLFGVPVDSDDALATTVEKPSAPETAIPQPEMVTDTTTDDAVIMTTEETIPDTIIDEPAPAPVVELTDIEPGAMPAPKKSRGRPRAVKKEDEETPAAPEADKVIPILSILATKSDADTEPTETADADIIEESIEEEITSDQDIIESDEEISEPVMETVIEEIIEDVEEEPVPVIEQVETTVIESVTIEEVIADDMPVKSQEKTLEELLESMAPLREDHLGEEDFISAPDDEDDTPASDGDTDATLAQLATEFAENQDKIIPLTKAESQGKIGKLKNILPFKKVKRDDSGIMGDLFGWAGIAANDEEFSMPGFFTNAAAKK